MKKPIKYEIIFEGEYTDEERDCLWEKFFSQLIKMKLKEIEKQCKTY